ncbi:MAG: hypothetical protein AAFR33_11585 [Pseudomonadota bacterium]
MNTGAGNTHERPVQASFEFASPPQSFKDLDRGEANAAAIEFLESVADWPFPVACLIGPARSGKSTLAEVWARSQNGLCLTPEALMARTERVDLSTTALAIDPADTGLPEKALLSLVNQAGERGGRLLLTAYTPPLAWHVKNKDLISRLASLPLAEIGTPDAEMVGLRLYSLLRRHFEAPPMDVIRFLEPRLKRTYADIESCAKRLAGRVGSGQGLTVLLASSVLTEMYGAEDEGDG